MKTLIALIVSIGISGSAFAQSTQQDTLPAAIKNHFGEKFANASALEWTLVDSVYTGTFTFDGERHLIEYGPQGNVRLHRYALKKTSYPATVLAPIQKDYATHKIDDIEIVERDGVITYEAELDGSPDYTVVFDSQGKVLSVKKD